MSFETDAREAMTRSPDYFVWWYTTKSLALCGALVALAYVLGRDAGRRGR